MKIRLAILESDEGYLKRIVSVFSTKYADKFEIYSFTELENALQSLAPSKIDVFVANESFEIDHARIPKRCGFAYFVDSADVDLLNNQPTICRFQKADLIYKQILSIYSENAGNYKELKLTDDGCRVIAFTSPGGGVGCTTMAAACAMHFAAQGHKALFLNLESFGTSDDFFSGEGQFDMSDVIYALKTRKANLAMKLESCVKQDPSGVYFFSGAKLALDMLELSTEETLRLISELRLTGSYDYLILDPAFSLSKDGLSILHQAHAVVFVGDGSRTSNTKLNRACAALSMKEQSEDAPIMSRAALLYNKYSSKTGAAVQGVELRTIGGAQRYEGTVEQILAQLSQKTFFDDIIR